MLPKHAKSAIQIAKLASIRILFLAALAIINCTSIRTNVLKYVLLDFIVIINQTYAINAHRNVLLVKIYLIFA